MELHRFFVDYDLSVGQLVEICGSEAHHIKDVLRLKMGYKLIVGNGGDKDYYAEIVGIDKDKVRVRIERAESNQTRPSVCLNLYQAVTKSDKFAFIVQKAVELGVATITPLITKYSNPNELNIDRLNKIIIEAAKQCGASAPPKLLPVKKLEEIEFDIPTFMGYENEQHVNYSDINLENIKELNLIIGSEGGFSPDEAARLRDLGVKTFSVGRRILRAETAAVAIIALTLYKAGGMRL